MTTAAVISCCLTFARPRRSLDFFVIATANSRRLSHAIASEIDAEMKKLGEHKLGMEGSEEGRWILIDYGDFVVHVFSGDARSYYALEELWGDPPRLEWSLPAPRASRNSRPPTVCDAYVGHSTLKIPP